MIAIIGAGISGLATAFYLKKSNIPYILFEASDRVGGYISTTSEDGYLMENGPNSLLCDDEVRTILEETGLKDKVVFPNEVSKARFILKGGMYRKLSPPSMLFGSFFNLKSKFAVLTEPFNKSKGNKDETVADFFRRRFSEQIVQYAVNPFVSGIYAGNPEKLLLRYTFPKLYELETEFGSIIKGFFKQRKSAGTGRKDSVSFNGGMETIVKTIAEQLDINLETPVNSIEKLENSFRINKEYEVSKIVITTPAAPTALITQQLHSDFSEALSQLNYPPMSIVHSVFKKEEGMFHFNGFGGLHPKVEGRFTAGSIWSSSLFNGRASSNEVLITSFVGGSLAVETAQMKDEEVTQKVTNELQELFNIKEKPIKQKIFRWGKAIPQYDDKLVAIEPFIEQLESENIYINANWWGGVSVADCLRKSKQLAIKLSN